MQDFWSRFETKRKSLLFRKIKTYMCMYEHKKIVLAKKKNKSQVSLENLVLFSKIVL